MVTIKSKQEIDIVREGGKRLAGILQKVVGAVKPGISTWELNRLAEGLIFECGGKPSFKKYDAGYKKTPFPASLCVSINDEIVHGIPQKNRVLKEGDLVKLDIGMVWPSDSLANGAGGRKGLYTDTAVTAGIGKISGEAERLLRVTKESLDIGISTVRPGIKLGDVSHAIQKHLEKNKLGVIRALGGHGVGYKVHEAPLIPNYGRKGTGIELKEGMVLAIEPMATLGDWRIKLADDGWTYKTEDGSLSAHFEHTVAVTKDRVEILTTL